jgi:hypothetical protein
MAIGFLHTAPEHTATFDALVVEHGGLGAARSHRVVPELLQRAMALGTDDTEVRERLIETLAGFPDGVDHIVVTCSTLGGIAEELAPVDGPMVTRVDRPMAEAAVAAGSRIGLGYSLQSTVVPTSALLWEVAQEGRRPIDLDLIDCEAAWHHFVSGELPKYLDDVAAAIRRRAHDVDVVVLAQASMAPAADRLGDLEIPVLSSPELAVIRALGK